MDGYIGIEIGASKIQAALGNSEGSLLEIKQHKVILADGARGILNWLSVSIPNLTLAAKNLDMEVKSLGIGFGGILETDSGLSIASVQVKGWENFNIRQWFKEQFKLPVLVLNDTVAGGCGEYYCCTKRDAKVFFYTNIGSGIGGCLLIDGRYFDGSGVGGPYFGNTYIPDKLGPSAGSYIKIETFCSGFGIEKRLRQKNYVPPSSLIYELCKGNVENITAPMLEKAGTQGDAFALEEIERIADAFALGLGNAITLFGADQVVIGGGMAKMGELLLAPMRKHLEKYVFFSATGRYSLCISKLMDNAVLVGTIVAAAGKVKAL